MKFTILSHAGMLVESEGVKLIIDPWIIGSCYWRSWWNYPKAVAIAPRVTGLDYIYLTHMHWDHFHGPSLRKLPKSATVLIPLVPSARMREDVSGFGFKTVVELPHGKPVSLSPRLRIVSYQYGLSLDSLLVISDGEATLINMNDCKIKGWPLHHILRRHPNVDFLFRSHSSASAYPHCVETEDPAELRYRTNEDYMREFVAAASLVRPRYAVPFASNHCFLHRETWRYNQTIISPIDVQRYFEAHGPEGSRCVVMVPGDSWSHWEGFKLREHDFFTHRDRHLAAYAEEVAPLLHAHYRTEDAVKLPFSLFQKYFQDFMASLPWLTRIVFKPVVVFSLSNRQEACWVLDFDQRLVYEARELPPRYAFKVRVHPAVLRDCIQKSMFSVFTASKRLFVEIKKGCVKDFLIFFQILDLYEYEYLPIRKTLTRRFIKTYLRRWREAGQYAAMLLSAFWRRKGGDPILVFIPKVSQD
jgi:UDP-MurNAc hydroxylase